MLRITRIAGTAQDAEWKLEGKLIAPWLDVLNEEIGDGARGGRLHLAGVTYADRAGIAALRRLLDAGFVAVDCPGLLTELLATETRK
jgi:hypothetical protein